MDYGSCRAVFIQSLQIHNDRFLRNFLDPRACSCACHAAVALMTSFIVLSLIHVQSSSTSDLHYRSNCKLEMIYMMFNKLWRHRHI
jgi:hypothetical protein